MGGAVEFAEVGGEVGEARTDGAGVQMREAVGNGVGGLEAVAGDAGDRCLVLPDATVGVEACSDGRGDAACGLGEDAFGLGELLDAGDDFYVGDIFGPSARVANHARGGGAVGGVADGERAGDGVGALRDDFVSSVLDCGGDGRAAGGLGSEEADRFVFDEAEVDELVEGLANFADERATGHGDDDVVGQAPSELLGDLVAYGLGAFGVVGAEIHVDEAPVVFVGDLGAETVDVIVVAVDANEAGAVDLGVENLCGLEVGGDEDGGLEAEAGGLRGDGVGEVAGGGAADGVEAELARVGEGDGDDAIFEAEGWEADGIVFDEEIRCADALAEIGCANERSEAYGEVGLETFRDRKESGIAPDVRRTGSDVFFGEDAANGVEVVAEFEGIEAVGARGEGLVAVSLAALIALQLIAATGIIHDALSE